MNKLCTLLLMVMSIMTFLTVVNGDCKTIPPHYSKIGPKIVVTCEHDHMEYMVGSIVRTTDCEECTCTVAGMVCCGIGPKADGIDVPEGFKRELQECV